MWPEHWYTVGSWSLAKVLFTSLKDFSVTDKKEILTKEEMTCTKIFEELDSRILQIFSSLSPLNIERFHFLKAVRP